VNVGKSSEAAAAVHRHCRGAVERSSWFADKAIDHDQSVKQAVVAVAAVVRDARDSHEEATEVAIRRRTVA